MFKELAKRLGAPLYRRNPGTTWDVESWIADTGAILPKFEVIRERGAAGELPAPRPAAEGVVPVRFAQVLGTFRRYEAWVPQAMIAGEDAFTIMPDGTFLVQPAWAEGLVTDNPVYFKRFQPKFESKSGSWFNPLLYWHSGYYHWICQVLPRFHQIIERLHEGVRIVVPGRMQPWMWDSLECIGINRSRCEPFAGSTPWRLENLIYVPPVAMAEDHDEAAMAWLRSTMLRSFGISGGLTRKIYLSRKEGTSRRILNETELMPILQAAGFEVLHAEDLPFAEQVAVFAHASHVIAPHGGGLANLAWASKGCRVLEIFNPDVLNRRCYWTLSNTMGLNHAYLVGEWSDVHGADAGYVVDARMFREALNGFTDR